MEKKLSLILIVCLIIFFPCKCSAYEIDYNEFFSNAPDEFNDLTIEEAKDEVSFGRIFKRIIDEFGNSFRKSANLLFSTCAIIILFSLLKNFQKERHIYNNIIASTIPITVIAITIVPLEKCLEQISEHIDTAYVFCTSAVPIILGLCISSGNSFSGVVFSTSVSFVSSLLQKISGQLLLPLTIILLSFIIIGTFSSNLNISSIEKQIKKFLKWVIGAFITFYSLVMSLQSFLSHSSDTMLKRAIKNAVGSFVPIVGNTLSTTVDSFFIIASNTKTSLAVIGIIIIIVIFLPVFAMCICNGAALSIAKSFAYIFNDNNTAKIVGSVAEIFFLLSGICATCVIMIIFSFLIICINIY